MQKFLITAQEYSLARGDDDMFCEVYSNYRQVMDIHDSTFMAIQYLYGANVAAELQEQSCPSFV